MRQIIVNLPSLMFSSAPRIVLLVALVLASSCLMMASDTPGATDIRSLVEALKAKGCTEDTDYHAIGGVPCPDAQNASGGADPDAVLKTLGERTKNRIAALTLQARKEDAACAQGAAKTAAGGASVGPSTGAELADALVRSAVDNAASLTLPTGMILSIPGVTQIQYDYKGLFNGPEVRGFKISGHLEGDVADAKLRLKMDGDVEGDKNLYVEYTVNYAKTKSPFPAWSPFLDKPGDVRLDIVRQELDTFSTTADFSEKGQHRNGVQVWQDYEYTWHAEKVGALPKDIVKQSGGALSELAQYPYGGDWVGIAWGSETRFQRTRKEFVAQFSPGLAGSMPPSEGVLMSLNVKHQAVFYFHIDFDGKVSGRGTVTYTLDPNLCAVAVLTRQINEQINFMKYLPMIFTAARALGELAVSRFQSAWAAEPSNITAKVDEFIRTLPPKVEPSAGLQEVDRFLAAHPEIEAEKVRNLAFADVDVNGYPKARLWRPSGRDEFPAIPDIVPVPTETKFLKGEWSQEFVLDESGWNAVLTGKKPYPREFDSERMLMEYLAKNLPTDASGTIRIYSKFPVCPRCTGVIEQFYWKFPKVTLLVTSGS